MRGRAWQESGKGGARAGSQERESSLGSGDCRGEGRLGREAGPGLPEASGWGSRWLGVRQEAGLKEGCFLFI